MNFVFWADPLEAFHYEKDTTYVLMLAAQERGHRVFWCGRGDLSSRAGRATIHALECRLTRDRRRPFKAPLSAVELAGTQVDVVLMRRDPPFDASYLADTLLLDLLPPNVTVINSPRGLRAVNEKLWITRFPHLTPETLVTRRIFEYESFLRERGRAVLKPYDGFGGQGVMLVAAGDPNKRVAFELLSVAGERPVIVQAFEPRAGEGDKRVWLLGGDPFAAVLRLHGPDDHRNNLASGGSALPAEITDEERAVAAELKPWLLAEGLHLVGLDFLGGALVEVNVTSPTCLQEANAALGRGDDDALWHEAIAYVEGVHNARRRK